MVLSAIPASRWHHNPDISGLLVRTLPFSLIKVETKLAKVKLNGRKMVEACSV